MRAAYNRVHRPERNAYLDGLRAIAERATGDAWPLIEELATLLQQRRSLPGAEVERFLRLRARASGRFAPAPSEGDPPG